MALVTCDECGSRISGKAVACAQCGNPVRHVTGLVPVLRWGFEWRSKAELFGWPLIHIAIGWSKKTGKLMVAKGIIAIGQFGIGLITVAQFGVGLLFGLGQFVTGVLAIGHFALAGVCYILAFVLSKAYLYIKENCNEEDKLVAGEHYLMDDS